MIELKYQRNITILESTQSMSEEQDKQENNNKKLEFQVFANLYTRITFA